MSADRFIHFRGGSDALGGNTAPSVDQLVQIIEDYVGEVGKVEFFPNSKTGSPWICCTLLGRPQHPLRRILPEDQRHIVLAQEQLIEDNPERWFEVIVQTQMDVGFGDGEDMRCKTIDVLTRQQDVFTNIVADGLVKILTQYYRAKGES